jgi:Lamin Tail Domain
MKSLYTYKVSLAKTFIDDVFDLTRRFSNTAGLQLIVALCSFCILGTAKAALVINEVDYEQPGTDTADFVELYNSDAFGILFLGGYQLKFFSDTGSQYRSTGLSGTVDSKQYFLLCGNGYTGAGACNEASGPSDFIQSYGLNLAGSIGLYDPHDFLIGGISYGGAVNPSGFGIFNTTAIDSNAVPGSLSRGADTNWAFTQCISPGATNCTSAMVPVPAAVWLFGTGLVGLSGIARYRQVG